jgi:type III pantothenate kinase
MTNAPASTPVLLVDLGNTALKWTLSTAGHSPAQARSIVHRECTDLPDRLRAEWSAIEPGTPAVGCSVAAAEVRDAVASALREVGVRIDWLGAEARHAGVVVLFNGYRVPTQLGADRWHGMLGACQRHPGEPFVLLAAGTATTLDCVESGPDGARFIGGCIAPGARMMLDALNRGTGSLPLAQGAPRDFPDNTDDAIATGVRDAQAGLAWQIVRRFARRLGHDPRLLVSGGDAEAVAARLEANGLAVTIEHNLVLAGLALRAVRMTSCDR